MVNPTILAPGEGKNYDWSADHTFVKVSAADTGGAYALMEDNLKLGFKLGLHMHRSHAETFYVLEGVIHFHINGVWKTAHPGATVHIPAGHPHAVELESGQTGKMLMIYQPAGFDQYLAELARMSSSDFEDVAKMAALDERYDLVQLGDAPLRP